MLSLLSNVSAGLTKLTWNLSASDNSARLIPLSAIPPRLISAIVSPLGSVNVNLDEQHPPRKQQGPVTEPSRFKPSCWLNISSRGLRHPAQQGCRTYPMVCSDGYIRLIVISFWHKEQTAGQQHLNGFSMTRESVLAGVPPSISFTCSVRLWWGVHKHLEHLIYK